MTNFKFQRSDLIVVLLVALAIWNPSIPAILPSKATAACIIEKVAERSKLPAGQIAVISSSTFPAACEAAGVHFLGCFDAGIVDKGKQPPADLLAYLKAAEGKPLPVLATMRGSKVSTVPVPASESEAIAEVKR